MKFHPLLLAVLLPLCSSLPDPVVETLDEPEFCTFRADLGDTMKLHLEVWEGKEPGKGKLLSGRYAEKTGRTLPITLNKDMHWERKVLYDMCVEETRSVLLTRADAALLPWANLEEEEEEEEGGGDPKAPVTVVLKLSEVAKSPKVEQFHPGLKFGDL